MILLYISKNPHSTAMPGTYFVRPGCSLIGLQVDMVLYEKGSIDTPQAEEWFERVKMRLCDPKAKPIEVGT